MKRPLATTWPPLITDAKRPRYVVWRDVLLTAAAWLLVFWMAQETVLIIIDEIWVLAGYATFAPALDWRLWWHRLWPYGLVISAGGIWLVAWGVVSHRRILRYHYLAAPRPLTLDAEAARAGCSGATLTTWRELKIAVVELDANGHLTVRAGVAK